MSKTSENPDPFQPDPNRPGNAQSSREPPVSGGAALISAGGILVGSVIAGLVGGVIWNAIAPKPAYIVLKPGSADVINAETSAFITGDAWYCLIAVAGGLLIGLVTYRLAIRRYGPMPMAAVLIGGVLAGLTARWVGQNIGLARFNSMLVSSHHGAILHAPPVLGADASLIMWPAIVFWPLAACLVPAGFLVLASLRDRQASLEPPMQPPV
ncbi:MAG TPA: hypothetical protein VFQ44_20030 [Streptosporangiaceae bacterium]|nr:hypothetical protein [Streptosporangiaceae bacterium]